MIDFYKRKLRALLAVLLMTFAFLLGCSPAIPPTTDDALTPPDLSPPSSIVGEQSGSDSGVENSFSGLSVHYLDVGQGDCILICFPDDKSMLIDCGNGSPASISMIIGALQSKKKTSLDYLVLTHPDSDHIASVKEALKDVAVKKLYHPEISEGKTGLDDYFSVLKFLQAKGAETEVSAKGELIGEDYKLAILSQVPRKRGEGAYKDFHLAEQPTESQINNLSPYIYLEYKGYRFLFTGDADKLEENNLINDYNSGLLKKTFANKGLELKLEEIDFLKVAHHGSDDSSSQDFLDLLKPKYAIISVGGKNSYGHPATSVGYRLQGANDNVEILRTDVEGTVSVFINTEGQMAIKTAKQENEA